MQRAQFESLPGIVGFVARAVSSPEEFRLAFPAAASSEEDSFAQAIRKPNKKPFSTNLDIDASMIGWVDEALADSFRLRRF